MGWTKPVKKNKKTFRGSYRVGQVVEVDFSNWKPELETASYACRVRAVFTDGLFLSIDYGVSKLQKKCITFEESNEVFGLSRPFVLEGDIFRVNPVRFTPDVNYHVGERVQVAWRLNKKCPIGWWKATVVKLVSEGRVEVVYDFKQNGFAHQEIVSNKVIRPL